MRLFFSTKHTLKTSIWEYFSHLRIFFSLKKVTEMVFFIIILVKITLRSFRNKQMLVFHEFFEGMLSNFQIYFFYFCRFHYRKQRWQIWMRPHCFLDALAELRVDSMSTWDGWSKLGKHCQTYLFGQKHLCFGRCFGLSDLDQLIMTSI